MKTMLLIALTSLFTAATASAKCAHNLGGGLLGNTNPPRTVAQSGGGAPTIVKPGHK